MYVSEIISSEFLTKGEEKLFNAMLGVESVKMAALKAGITPHTAYNMLYRIRQKYKQSRGYVNVIDAQKRRRGLFRKVLGKKKPKIEGLDIEF